MHNTPRSTYNSSNSTYDIFKSFFTYRRVIKGYKCKKVLCTLVTSVSTKVITLTLTLWETDNSGGLSHTGIASNRSNWHFYWSHFTCISRHSFIHICVYILSRYSTSVYVFVHSLTKLHAYNIRLTVFQVPVKEPSPRVSEVLFLFFSFLSLFYSSIRRTYNLLKMLLWYSSTANRSQK